MILATYQPLNFPFNTQLEWNDKDMARRQEAVQELGVDFGLDYMKLLGKNIKPIFCFEVKNIPDTCAKSMTISPTCPQQLIIFNIDDDQIVTYDESIWNTVYNFEQIDDKGIQQVRGETKYPLAAHLVTQINENQIIYKCDINQVITTHKLPNVQIPKWLRQKLKHEYSKLAEANFKTLYKPNSDIPDKGITAMKKYLFERYYLPALLYSLFGATDNQLVQYNRELAYTMQFPIQMDNNRVQNMLLVTVVYQMHKFLMNMPNSKLICNWADPYDIRILHTMLFCTYLNLFNPSTDQAKKHITQAFYTNSAIQHKIAVHK